MPDTVVLENQAAAEFAQRSRSGVLAYPVIYGIIGVFTPYAADHPRMFATIGALILIATVARAICAFSFHKFYQFNSKTWRRISRASVVSLGNP